MVRASLGGNVDDARRQHIELFPLFKAMFLETNPIPIKTAMKLAGTDSGELRLPLCPMADQNAAKLETLLRQHGILNAATV